MTFEGLYNIRDANKNDHNFILATFLRGVYHGDTFFSQVPKDLFMSRYKLVAQGLVNDPNTKIKVACLPDDPDVVLGYSILSGDYSTVNFVFVKNAWRLKGIGRSLLPKDFKYVVPQHITGAGKIILTKFPTVKMNPFF